MSCACICFRRIWYPPPESFDRLGTQALMQGLRFRRLDSMHLVVPVIRKPAFFFNPPAWILFVDLDLFSLVHMPLMQVWPTLAHSPLQRQWFASRPVLPTRQSLCMPLLGRLLMRSDFEVIFSDIASAMCIFHLMIRVDSKDFTAASFLRSNDTSNPIFSHALDAILISYRMCLW